MEVRKGFGVTGRGDGGLSSRFQLRVKCSLEQVKTRLGYGQIALVYLRGRLQDPLGLGRWKNLARRLSSADPPDWLLKAPNSRYLAETTSGYGCSCRAEGRTLRVARKPSAISTS